MFLVGSRFSLVGGSFCLIGSNFGLVGSKFILVGSNFSLNSRVSGYEWVWVGSWPSSKKEFGS